MSSYLAAARAVEAPFRALYKQAEVQPSTEAPAARTVSNVPTPAPSPAPAEPAPASRLSTFEFDTMEDFLTVLRPHLRFAAWQTEISNHFAGYLSTGQPRVQPTDREPMMYNIVAANGAGKDTYIIAPFACWFALTRLKGRCVITSSSHTQLVNQTFKPLTDMCMDFNELMGERVFDCTELRITCTRSGSVIKGFVTDEAGKAEGFHPDPTFANAEMAVIFGEAKSIPDDLWTAYSRFTGYNYWIELSSPGGATGHFYRTSTSVDTVRHPEVPVLGKRYVRHITAYECPWISHAHISDQISQHGENSSFVKSSILAQFTDLEAGNFIKEDIVMRCRALAPRATGTDIGIGMDIAAGGDEFTIYVRRGNEPIDKFFWRQRDTSISVELADKFLESYKRHAYTFNADNGGLGHPIIDQLALRGWRIQRRNNQSPASAPRLFGNLGAQMYWHLKRLIERAEILLPDDQKTMQQLMTRALNGRESAQGKITLQSKKEARSQGQPSPDRADALVLCFFSYRTDPTDTRSTTDERMLITADKLAEHFRRGLPPIDEPQDGNGRFTYLTRRFFSKGSIDI
jgi:hypothetical protein